MPRRSHIVIVVATLLSFSRPEVSAQATAKFGNAGSSPLAKLCMPVSYRETSATEPIKTKIPMLSDRYREVVEALSGWNEAGIPLVGRRDGRWEPVPCGDDTGLFYIIPFIARISGTNAESSLERSLLGLIILSAIVGLVGMWLGTPRVWERALSIAPVIQGSYLSYKMGDVYVVQAALVLALIPWFLYAHRIQLRTEFRLLIVFFGGILLGFGQWIRTQSGLAPLVFFAVLLATSCLQRTIKLLLALTLVIGVSLPLLYSQVTLHERDRFLALHQHAYQPPLNSHMLWHSVYLGFGYLNNPYVLAWKDVVAVDYVKSIDPTVIYGSGKYEALLRLRVGQIARDDLRFVFYTFAAKAGVLACILLVSVNIGLAAAAARPKPARIEAAFWIALAVAATPGIIAIPIPQYVTGMIVLACYYWYYSIAFYIENSGPPSISLKRVWLLPTGAKCK